MRWRVKSGQWRGATAAVVVLLALGTGPVPGARAAGRSGHDLAALRTRIAVIETTLSLLQQDSRRWAAWCRSDQAVEAHFRKQQPGFGDRVRWRDPDCRVLTLPWVLTELSRNVEVLQALGKHREAQRLLAVAGALAWPPAGDEDISSMLLLNSLSRFLLAGWRDAGDPLAALEGQVTLLIRNLQQLRQGVRPEALLPAGTHPVRPGPAVLLTALVGGHLGHLPGHLALRGAGIPRLAGSLLPLVGRGHPALRGAEAAAHSALLDELSLALNLPFSLAPPGAALERFLETAPAVTGALVLLGAGDGAEARVAAEDRRWAAVLSVDHSLLATERTRAMAARLDGYLPVPVRAVHGDAAGVVLPDGMAAAVAANHLLEYLEPEERRALYARIQEWLVPGGTFFAAVHLARGPRFEALRGFGNITLSREPTGTRLIMSGLIPGTDAVHVQHYFDDRAWQEELAAAGFDAAHGYRIDLEVVETGVGFVQAAVRITKRPQD